jgi:hypothetical protein
MSLSLVIERHGDFAVTFKGSNASQCGALGTQILRYVVRITGSEDHLTDQGFIIDNNDIHRYFVNTYKDVQDFESCERIATKACRDFKAMFGVGPLSNVHVSEIAVTVGGSPQAGITATWKNTRRK